MDGRGRRKRKATVTIDDDAVEDIADSCGGYSFTLERLAGIFIQISTRVVAPNVIGDDDSMYVLRRNRCSEPKDSFRDTVKTYGDAFFSSTIKELISCRVLLPRSNLRLDLPLYTWFVDFDAVPIISFNNCSTLHESVAFAIARNLRFDLQSHLVHGKRG